jgi:pilus assembly protein Flp/PilA
MKQFVAVARKVRDRGLVNLLRARRFLKEREEGASLVEYALLIAFIALVCIAAVRLLGTTLLAFFNNVAGQL